MKGENKRKHQKRKHPQEACRTNATAPDENSDEDNNMPVIVISDPADETHDEDFVTDVDRGVRSSGNDEFFIDLTGEANGQHDIFVDNVEEVDVITAKETTGTVYKTDDINIPNAIYWESILSSIERCNKLQRNACCGK